MNRLAVFGYPISHSKSPDIYNFWINKNWLYAYYTRISARSLSEIKIIDNLLDLSSFNLTSPLKSIFYQEKNVNTVLTDVKSYKFYNTDNEYFEELLTKFELNEKKILIIGGGESAKNIANTLYHKKLNYDVIIRNPELKKPNIYFTNHILNINNINELIDNYGLIINTIKFTKQYLNDNLVFENKIIIDLIYQSEIFSNIMINCNYISGYDWLIGQAIKSFKYYYPELYEQKFFKENFNNNVYKPISLIGFMGSGKTTIGKIIAEKLSYNFIDTDELIVQKYGEIRDIFIDYGEERFREMELEMLTSIDTSKNTIISTGGGILRNEESMEFLEKNTYRIWLLSKTKDVYKRIKGTDRPLLKNYKHFYQLFEYRKEDYFINSDLIVFNSDINSTVERLVEEILNIVPDRQFINVSSNKSHFQRILICSLLSNKKITIRNYTYSEDNQVLINCFKNLGYSIDLYDNYIIVNEVERIKMENYELDVQSSGFAARVLPILFINENANFKINYNERIFDRNLDELVNIFLQFGLEIKINATYLEFRGSTSISSQQIECNGNISSQYLSALLLFIAFKNEMILQVNNLKSLNYIDLTLDVLSKFGKHFNNNKYQIFSLNNKSDIEINEISIEGDWSGAANLIILAIILGKGRFANLEINSKQGDSIIFKLLKNIGATINYEENTLIVEKSKLSGFEFDAENYPDLVPAIIPLALFTQDNCIIKNVDRLRFKESNRLDELITSYKKLNAEIEYKDNSIYIYPSQLKFENLDPKGDHRLAMSYAIAYKLINPKIQLILDECVNKSYPSFYEQVNLIEIYE